MAYSPTTINDVPLFFLSILLSFRYVDFFLHFFTQRAGSGRRRGTPTRSLLITLFATILVVSIYAFYDPIVSPGRGAEAVSKVEEVRREMEVEMQALKDHIFQLESRPVETTKKMDVKLALLEENSNVIEAMQRDIQYLIHEQQNIEEVKIQALKDHIFQLASCLVETTKKLDVRIALLEENNNVIEAMQRDIEYLIDEQQNIKDVEIQDLKDHIFQLESSLKEAQEAGCQD